MDFYLKFKSESEATEVLYDNDTPKYRNMDILGILYKTISEEEVQELEGWHVNIRTEEGEDTEALEPYSVPVPKPRRMWL
jgi:hypothetical protein